MNAQADATTHLFDEVVWRLEICTPLHAGSGEKLVKGLDVESAGGWTYAIDAERFIESLLPAQLDRVGQASLAELYGARPLREVQRYAIRGALPGPSFPDRRTELRGFARDGFGRPYLPGSTLKGALRTALMMKLAEPGTQVANALRAAASPRGRQDAKFADDAADQAAFRIGASSDSTDDVLRHLYVPDVLIPPACMEVCAVQVASMHDPAGTDWGWKSRGRSNVRMPDDHGVLQLYVEAVRPGIVLRVPLKIDAKRLRPDWMKKHLGDCGSKVQDFSRWEKLLCTGLLAAARSHGERLLKPEIALWDQSRPLTKPANALKALQGRLAESRGEAVFPVAWGIGWRGMTGAALERIDGASKREADANESDTQAIADARRTYRQLSRKSVEEYPVFPKSRRLALTERGDPALPMGWVAARPWKDGDRATAIEAVNAPEGRLDTTVRGAAPPPRVATHFTRGFAKPPPRPAPPSGPKAGDIVQCRLMPERSKKGNWRAQVIVNEAEGVIDPAGVPDGLVPGQEVELVVKNTATAKDGWGFTWPKKK